MTDKPTKSNSGALRNEDEFIHPPPIARRHEEAFVHPRPTVAPSFGQTSQMRSSLTSSNVFNIPKTNRPRPEHHRTKDERPRYPSGSDNDGFYDPVEMMNRQLLSRPTGNSIQAPLQPQMKAIQRPPVTKYSSLNSQFSRYAQDDNLKKDLRLYGMSQVDAALFEDKYGAYVNLSPVNQEKAAKDVKALLEGAFDEDGDKPRVRRQRKKLAEAIDDLASKMKDVKVEDKLYPDLDKEVTDGSASGGGGEEEADDDDEVDDGEEADDGTREGLKVKLLPHQILGVDWMLKQELGSSKKKAVSKGGILADDMGLGKTIQTISLLLLNSRRNNKDSKLSPGTARSTLVVAPLALIKQWERELADKVEDSHYMKVLVHHGPKRTKSGSDLRKYDVVITTYQTITSEHEASSPKDDGRKVGCFDVSWYRVILDEAHTIKNRNAKCTKGCYDLRSEYRWCLTGTPMQNHLDELHSLITFLRIKSFSQKNFWKEKILDPMSKGQAELAIQRLQALLKTVMKRRTKDVLRKQAGFGTGNANTEGFKLVGRKAEVVKVKFTPRELEFYKELQKKADMNIERMMNKEQLNFAGALALLLRLRQACNHKELIQKEFGSDPDGLEVVAKSVRSRSPNKSSQGSSQIVDDLASLLGGMDVNEKQCELCGDELSREETSSKMKRCVDCNALIEDDEKISKQKKHYHKKPQEHKLSRKDRNRRVIIDGDDDEEGDWVVPENQRSPTNLGKAGGTDDEDAEGGGQWLGSDDSDTDENSSIKVVNQKKQPVWSSSTDDSSTECDEEGIDESITLRSSTKILTMLKILRKEVQQHKFIIFSEWTSMLNLLEPFLNREEIEFCRYDGKMKNDAREASLEKLRKDKDTRVLLCSLKCGSLGLNLTAASRVIIMEPFWNPFVEEQAIDRVHRLNQTVDVVVYRLTIEDTVEERIFELQNQKRELADAALEGKAIAKLSMNELLNLFKHDAEHYAAGSRLGQYMLGLDKTQAITTQNGSVTTNYPLSSPVKDQRPQQKPKSSARPEHAVYGRRW